MGWDNVTHVEPWDSQWEKARGGSYHYFYNPFNPDAIADADVRTVQKNETTLVVAVENDETVNAIIEGTVAGGFGSGADSYLEFHIDRDTGNLERAIIEVTAESNISVAYDYRFSNYGETTVERPDPVPRFTLEGIFYDVVYA